MLRVHGYLVSTWTRTVLMTCAEKGVDWELVPVAYGSDAHGELHPFRRMPIVEHGDRRIIEGLAVTGYIDEAFDGPPLQPSDVAGRTAMREWMSLCGDYVFRDVVRTVPRDRDITDEEFATARLTLERVNARIGSGPFLVGDELTLADLYLAPQVSNAREKHAPVLEGLDALMEWFARLEPRESFQQTSY